MAVANGVPKTWALALSYGGRCWSAWPAGDRPIPPTIPVPTADPVLGADQPREGVAHAYTPGTWTDAVTVTAQWMLDGVAIEDALTYPSLVMPVGSGSGEKVIAVQETATSVSGHVETVTTQAKQVLPP